MNEVEVTYYHRDDGWYSVTIRSPHAAAFLAPDKASAQIVVDLILYFWRRAGK